MRSRFARFVAITAAVALVGAAFASPAVAAKKKKALKCGQFAPGVEAAAESEVVKITPKATEEAPVVIEFEHGAAGPSNPYDGSNFLNEEKFFNVQVFGPSNGLYIRQEFSEYHDLDLYLFNAAGEEVASSGAFNATPVAVGPLDFSSGGNGGTNYESISGYPASTCEGFTIRSNAYLTPGTDVALKIWFGEVVAPE